MCMMHGVASSFVPAVMLLAVSFFILLAARKSDSGYIKTFGYAIAVLLWVAAALVFGGGVSARQPMFHGMNMMGRNMGRPMPHSEVPQQAEQAAPTK